MKKVPSKLDAHVENLAKWFSEEKLTLAQAVQRLASVGVKVSPSRLSDWWAGYQEQELHAEAEARLYADLATGSRIAREVGEMAAAAPTDVSTLVKLMERLILQISVRGEMPAQMKVLPALVRTALEGIRMQLLERKVSVDEGKLELLQAKAAKAEEAERVVGDPTMTPEEKQAQIHAIFGMT
ncbi:MAG: hypothetical protein KF791_08410 [Verrucomicrobiae bacterium]|nr:hypothetical protein [Verrucomicrobiae bacterium]